jgi:4'-phosphopantetheinyl transferase EntD
MSDAWEAGRLRRPRTIAGGDGHPPGPAPLRARMATLFGRSGIIAHEGTLADDGEPLYEEEDLLVTGASEKRRRDFVAGRRCARAALARLGIHDFPLLAGPDRAPLWPGAVVGSITHTEAGTHGYCGAAVAHRRLLAGLGIDAEPRLPLPVELWPRVLDPDEGRLVLAAEQPGVQARLLFSAKEATYKALYPLRGRFLDFSDVHIRFLPGPGCFVAELAGAAQLAAPGPLLLGRFLMDDELLITAVLLPASGSPLAQEWLSLGLVPC